MENNLRKELKILAERILDNQNEFDLEFLLDQSRMLYEKCIVLQHLNSEEAIRTVSLDKPDSIEETPETPPQIFEELKFEKLSESEISELQDLEKLEKTDDVKDEEPIISLNDLFVPTFDDIREDMSQKDEFKDTVSLDDTENMFVTEREEPKQLSLNDKLVGSSLQVGLNDRIAFVNKLFNFSQSDFNKVLTKLNSCNSKDEALRYFQYQVKPNYNWKGKEDLEERFVILIERKFM
jgi:hypothetical protein